MSDPKPKTVPTHEQAEDRPLGSGRRAYVRYPVVLDATVINTDGMEVPCEMRDFCMGGMLLMYRPPAVNTLREHERLVVRSMVPAGEADKILEFKARVVRLVQGGIGIAFINPEREGLQAMQQYALQHTRDADKRHAAKAASSGAEKGRALLGRRFVDVVAGCGRVVEETMDTILGQFGGKLSQHLFEQSRDTKDLHAQNTLFSASQLIKDGYTDIVLNVRRSFQDRLQDNIKKLLEEKKSQESKKSEFSLENMTLIGDEDLGAWLAVSEVTTKVEEKCKEALTNLEQRLSILFNTPITHANNPYGPALFAESIQAGISQFQFKENINTICFSVLKDILVNVLSDLYAKLNDILIKCGILPDLKFSVLSRSSGSEHDSEEESGGSESQQSSPEARNGATSKATSEPAQASSGAQNGLVAKEAQKATPPAGENKQPAENASQQDLYQVMRELRALREGLAQHRVHSVFGSAGPGSIMAGLVTDDLHSGNCFSTTELVEKIADLQGMTASFDEDGAGLASLKERIGTVLQEQCNTQGKKISIRDGNVLEVAGDLLDAMRTDPLVADSVKPWLRQLELPVIKLALRDPAMFFDQSHVVRQVVNNIAQLEFYRQDKGGPKQNSISNAIESLLENIAKEHEDGVEIFVDIQEKLTKLINVQNKAYEENVKDLIKECVERRPDPDNLEGDLSGAEDISAAEMKRLRSQGRRLKEGDNILFAPEGGVPQRMRVAWIDEDKSLYVLVNLRGIREKIFMIDDIARLIHAGILQPQANASDPAMDRAQYVIMQNLYQQVLHESTHDSMTGLIARREFEKLLNEALASAKREDLRHALLFIDVDKFSAINNSCGYSGGDRLLQDVAEILRGTAVSNGVVSRLGGDQFGILLNGHSLDEALAIAEHLIEKASSMKFTWKDSVFNVTLSIGLVPISVRSGDVDDLLKAAESSCNIAKDTGGNRLHVYHAGHARIAHEAEVMKWIGRIDKMLQEDTLEIRCQRIESISNDEGVLPYFEILVGVRDDEGNIVSPGEFIKAAEWYRRMPAVDRYIISKTLAWMDEHAHILDTFDGFSINLSGQSISEEGFIDFIIEQLGRVSVPCNKICFEVTETAGISNLSDASAFIERIKEMGCRFALDDFGSGMSSYGYLKNLPIDVVKIDGAFVKNLAPASSDYAVIKSITDIAHFMRKKVVAEYVESEEVLNLLREIGVDYVQGFMFDKPDSIDRLLQTHSVH